MQLNILPPLKRNIKSKIFTDKTSISRGEGIEH